MKSVSPPSSTHFVPQREYASRMNMRTRSASSEAPGYCCWMNDSVRTVAGRPLCVFQSASGWNDAANASVVMMRYATGLPSTDGSCCGRNGVASRPIAPRLVVTAPEARTGAPPGSGSSHSGTMRSRGATSVRAAGSSVTRTRTDASRCS